uniref:Putative secreted protein n=1 Tax=Ixodes ricinus TaxID=34613 RepID=A0A6B0UQ92_IXORI
MPNVSLETLLILVVKAARSASLQTFTISLLDFFKQPSKGLNNPAMASSDFLWNSNIGNTENRPDLSVSKSTTPFSSNSFLTDAILLKSLRSLLYESSTRSDIFFKEDAINAVFSAGSETAPDTV